MIFRSSFRFQIKAEARICISLFLFCLLAKVKSKWITVMAERVSTKVLLFVVVNFFFYLRCELFFIHFYAALSRDKHEQSLNWSVERINFCSPLFYNFLHKIYLTEDFARWIDELLIKFLFDANLAIWRKCFIFHMKINIRGRIANDVDAINFQGLRDKNDWNFDNRCVWHDGDWRSEARELGIIKKVQKSDVQTRTCTNSSSVSVCFAMSSNTVSPFGFAFATFFWALSYLPGLFGAIRLLFFCVGYCFAPVLFLLRLWSKFETKGRTKLRFIWRLILSIKQNIFSYFCRLPSKNRQLSLTISQYWQFVNFLDVQWSDANGDFSGAKTFSNCRIAIKLQIQWNGTYSIPTTINRIGFTFMIQ